MRQCGAQGRVRGSARRHAAAARHAPHVLVDGMTGGTDAFRHCNPRMQRRIHSCVESPNHEEAVMYSLQHVLWRGAMALSLLVVGGVGAGFSEAPVEAAQTCPPSAQQVEAMHMAARREVALLQRAQVRERLVREDA
jgi:hypothetical protein